ncbi:MAG: UDP-N-acetylglucosamine 2-epimerase (non-hydrolyzing) [Candidatus Marinimicrobia bacterium]|nr:UDP-N-acetylglucosamine 2-epimerase (non-hydrolyzing) [Candidatus Neomarinimicrobiota bacterium]
MNYKKFKIVTIVGTRPELIRLSRVIDVLDQNLNHVLVHTGQNYDYELNEIFFRELKIKKPDYFLNVDTSSLGTILGDTLIKAEKVLIKESPDAVLILGDTNSSISAIISKRMHIPIYHMEAGNRSFDFNVPEEINRRIIDHIADFNLVYTEHSRRHLIAEGIDHRRIYLTGSPMFEVLDYFSKNIDNSVILKELRLQPKKYFIVSMHREENVDNTKNLQSILSMLELLIKKYNLPIIVSTHPRTRKRINQLKNFKSDKNIKFLKPFGFFDYVTLQKYAYCTISDSGTISEESSILKFPAITIRNSMERPEVLDAGSIILTGFDKEIILQSIQIIVEQNRKDSIDKNVPQEYQIQDTSFRVLNLILGTAKLSNLWYGINKKD